MKDQELAGIVCARICHDLGNPIGAVVNGADLIRELAGGEVADELLMLERSARRAAAVLKFHRLAFGAVRNTEAGVARAALRADAEAVLGGPRVALDWEDAAEGPALPAPVARLAALMLLAGRAMLGIGGVLRVALPAGGPLPVAVVAEGDRAAAGEDQRRWLEGGAGGAPDPRLVEFALIPQAAHAAGARVTLGGSAGRVALEARAG